MMTKPTWLQDWQQQHQNLFDAKGFPTRRDEEWKYTNIQAIVEQEFAEMTKINISAINTSDFIEDCYRIVFVDGQFSETISNLPKSDQIKISTWQQSFTSDPECIRGFVNKFESAKKTPFTLLNHAQFNDGVIIRIKENTQLDKPICLHYLATSRSSSKINNMISIGANSQVDLYEQFSSEQDSHGYCNLVTNIWLSDNASLTYYKFQNNTANLMQTASLAVLQQRDSTVNAYHITLGGKLIRDDLHFLLAEPGAHCRSYGFYSVNGKQHYDCHSRIDHLVAHTSSDQIFKGIIDDQARAVFNGKVIVKAGANQTMAHQNNKNLLLSKTAEVDTKPELEIYAHDVRCSHGATVGQLDQSAIFYMRSRGLTEANAKQLLTYAFANDVLQLLPNNKISENIANKVLEKLALTQLTEKACG